MTVTTDRTTSKFAHTLTTADVLALAMVVAAFAILFTGCEDTGSARCNSVIPGQNYSIVDVHGWHISCRPPSSFTWPTGTLGWADPGTRTVWIRETLIDDDRLLKIIAWHEDGHVAADVHGLVFASQADAETWASRYAWCREQIYGVGIPGYGPPPDGCARYQP